MGFGGGISSGGSSGPELGTSINYVSATGVSNNVAPAGFGAGVGAIIVTNGGGASTWTGLQGPGSEGQTVRITYNDTGSLTLDVLNAGSSAANQFVGFAPSQTLAPGMSLTLQWRGALNSGAGAWSMQ